MKKNILLTRNPNGLSINVTKWLFILLGLIVFFNGADDLFKESANQWSIPLAVFSVASGLLTFTVGIIVFNPENAFAPKVQIDEDGIVVREDIFNRTKSFRWTDIRHIEFRPYAVDFLLNDSQSQLVILKTNAEASMEIKKSIKEVAERKRVTIRS